MGAQRCGQTGVCVSVLRLHLRITTFWPEVPFPSWQKQNSRVALISNISRRFKKMAPLLFNAELKLWIVAVFLSASVILCKCTWTGCTSYCSNNGEDIASFMSICLFRLDYDRNVTGHKSQHARSIFRCLSIKHQPELSSNSPRPLKPSRSGICELDWG